MTTLGKGLWDVDLKNITKTRKVRRSLHCQSILGGISITAVVIYSLSLVSRQESLHIIVKDARQREKWLGVVRLVLTITETCTRRNNITVLKPMNSWTYLHNIITHT